MGPRMREDTASTPQARELQGDGSPHARGHGREVGKNGGRRGGIRRRDSSTPLRFARNDMWVPGIAGKGGASQDEGMGPRIREDNGGRGMGVIHGGRVAGEGEFRQREDVTSGREGVGYGVWVPAPSSRGQALRGNTGTRWGGRGLTGAHERHPYEGMLSGLGFTPIPTFPHQGGRDLQTRNGLCGSLRMTGGRQYC